MLISEVIANRVWSVLGAIGLVSIAAGVVVTPAVAGRPPLAVVVPVTPRPVPGTDGRTHLAYEIVLRNDTGRAVRLNRVEVHAQGVLAVLDGTAIDRRLSHLAAGSTFSRTLPPGGSGMLLLDVTVPVGTRVPTHLGHRFEVATGIDDGAAVFAGAPARVERRAPMRLSPPLSGGDLAVFGCCGPPFGHRAAEVVVDGRLYLAQRYAVDFVRMDGGLNTNAGDPASNASYHIHGAAVMAVAPGRVLAVRDGMPENTPDGTIPEIPDGDALGNFVLQDLGGGRTATYAHLRPGSVRVTPGDDLGRGQRIAEVGNTGASFEPHLHLQVTDAPGLPSGLTADGLPFVFDHLRLDARIAGVDGPPSAWTRTTVPPPHRRVGQYPLTGDIVAFG